MGRDLSLRDYFTMSDEVNQDQAPMVLAADISEVCNPVCRIRETYQVYNHSSRTLSVDEWDHLFHEAQQAGVRYIFLMGGEPLKCKEILNRLGHYQGLMF